MYLACFTISNKQNKAKIHENTKNQDRAWCFSNRILKVAKIIEAFKMRSLKSYEVTFMPKMNSFNSLYIHCVCMCVHTHKWACTCTPYKVSQNLCGGKSLNCMSWFSPSPMWVPGIKQIIWVNGENLYFLSHFPAHIYQKRSIKGIESILTEWLIYAF